MACLVDSRRNGHIRSPSPYLYDPLSLLKRKVYRRLFQIRAFYAGQPSPARQLRNAADVNSLGIIAVPVHRKPGRVRASGRQRKVLAESPARIELDQGVIGRIMQDGVLQAASKRGLVAPEGGALVLRKWRGGVEVDSYDAETLGRQVRLDDTPRS